MLPITTKWFKIHPSTNEIAKFAITNNTNQTINQLHTPLYEPISIVIPYVVWGELDYISKKLNKNNNSLEQGKLKRMK